MSHEGAAVPHGDSDGLWRWLVGGLAAGGVVLGLLIAAYAVGYHRGQEATPAVAAAAPTTTTAPPATTTAAPPAATAVGPVAVTPASVSKGKALFAAAGCAGCHSLSGAAGAGPALNGVAGSTVTLDGGQTLTADDAYLEQSIADPDARVVKGFQPGLMSSAISSFHFAAKPADVRALVAFVKAQK